MSSLIKPIIKLVLMDEDDSSEIILNYNIYETVADDYIILKISDTNLRSNYAKLGLMIKKRDAMNLTA